MFTGRFLDSFVIVEAIKEDRLDALGRHGIGFVLSANEDRDVCILDDVKFSCL